MLFESLRQVFTIFAAPCNSGAGSRFLDFPTWYQYLDSAPVAGKCSPIVRFPDDMGKILLAVAEIILRIGGLVAVGFVIYGGFLYILSQGQTTSNNVPKATIARKVIINSLIGLVISVIATFIVTLVANVLTT